MIGRLLCLLVLICIAPLIAATEAAPALVSVPAAELVQILRNTGDEGLPKGLNLTLFSPYSLAVTPDYVYVGSIGAINYLKREAKTGRLTYVGSVPWNFGRVAFCVIGNHLYALGPGHEKNEHGYVWFELESSTGKPIEKGSYADIHDGGVTGPIASADGKSFYFSTCWAVHGFKLESDGKPVAVADAAGKGVRYAPLRIAQDGNTIYSVNCRIDNGFDLAWINRKPDGVITYGSSLSLKDIAKMRPEYSDTQSGSIAGISPDGKWVHVAIIDRLAGNTFATYRRDPATGALTLKESGGSNRTDREDFKLANLADVHLLFNPEGTGGFITNSRCLLQSFRYDSENGRISDISDVVVSMPGKGNCRPMAVAFDSTSGFLYGAGVWQVDSYGGNQRGLFVMKTSMAKVTAGGRTDLIATAAKAPDRNAGKWAADSDWPRYRGPNGDGVSSIKNIQKEFSSGLAKVWEVSGLSPGDNTWSAPAVQGNKLIVVGTHGFIDEVFCFDADKGGRPLWITEVEGGGDVSRYGGRDGWRGGPTPTPAISGDKVFCFAGGFLCLSLADGKVLWSKGTGGSCHGYSCSPLVQGDLVIAFGIIQPSGKPALLSAMKVDTGETVWTYGGEVNGEGPSTANTSPLCMKINGVEQVVYNTAALACGLDAKTGKPFWEHKTSFATCNVNATDPVTDGKTVSVLLGEGSAKPYALQIENGAPKVAWEKSPNWMPMWSDAVFKDGYIYMYSADGLYSGPNSDFRCVDINTGVAKWIERKTGCGSVVLADGFLISLTYAGNLLLLSPTPEGYKKVSEWKGAVALEPWWTHDGGKSSAPAWTGPVIARGKIYLRYCDKLTCYELAQ